MTRLFKTNLGFLLILTGLLQLYTASATEHAKGLLPEDPKTLAAVPKVEVYRDFIAPEADLSSYFPKPGNQGQQGSCTAWATAYAARTYHEAKQQGVPPRDSKQSFSPAYVYNQTKSKDCIKGAVISDALNLLKRKGVPRLTDFPYDPTNCSRIPDATVVSEAASFKIDDWKTVDEDNLDSIKGQIFSGTPVIFGLETSESFDYLHKGQIYNDLTSKRTSSHAMVLIGYSESKQAFKLINSWGTDWGDNGYAWITYKAFQKWVQNAYVMELASAPTPIPTVLPEPIVVPRPPNITNENIEKKLKYLISKTQCSKLSGTLNNEGNLTLTGFARKREDLNNIKSEMAAIGVQVTLNTELRPWPQCEVLLTLNDVLVKSNDLQLTVSGGNTATLKEDEPLVIEVTTPGYPSYLYLTYVQANGDALNLVRPLDNTPSPIDPNTHLIFGNGQKGNGKFKISAPFGNEILVAIASSKPLFDNNLPKNQIERAYLTQIRQALLTMQPTNDVNQVVSAAVVPIMTQSKY